MWLNGCDLEKSSDSTIWRVEMMTIYFDFLFIIITQYSIFPFLLSRPLTHFSFEKLPPESLLYVFTYSIAQR